ncbi:MAG TPA: EAL domain-containing protein [Burkholderiales bacterium]|nr:EAL domain-containing protein [Burkholderiales bacterium]
MHPLLAQPRSLPDKQAIRLQRYSLAAVAYMLILLPLAAAAALGIIRQDAALQVAAAIVGLNAAVYATLRSGLNLRFSDPSLTTVQLYLAIAIVMLAAYHTETDRGVTLSLCFLVFLFGVFRLTTAQFFRLTLYTLAAYALVINLLMHLRPEAVVSVYNEGFNWLLLAATLPWFALVGGKISALRERLRGRNLQLEEAIDTIHAMATRDDATGLYSRAFFTESLRHALLQAERHGRGAALLFIDLDRFKNINDSMGHAVGDRVLREIGARVAASVRGSDLVGRLGGDEFVVLVESVTAPEALHEIAQKVVRAAAQPLAVDGQELLVSVSVGIAVAPTDGRDEQTLMRNADIAMYRAKSLGRNGYSFYAEQMSADARERLTMEAELARAIERGELLVYFQPKIRIADGRIAGVEALVRWQHPRHGLLEPGRFIHIAEETGAILPIGRWVLERACAAAAEMSGEIRMAVNLSARQFSDPRLVDQVQAALKASGLDPSRLEIEITESTVMPDPDRSIEVMRALRESGVRLSMDDFGTGYSSLGYLKQFPLNTVKIDRSFVNDLPNGRDDAAIARAVLAMARALGMEVVAEGVERIEQLEFLRREGCDEYQGYYSSRPVTEEAFRALLRTETDRLAG